MIDHHEQQSIQEMSLGYFDNITKDGVDRNFSIQTRWTWTLSPISLDTDRTWTLAGHGQAGDRGLLFLTVSGRRF